MKNFHLNRKKFNQRTSYLLSICLYTFCLLIITFFASPQVYGQEPILKHSYTFDNGTANDIIGNAHGKLVGGEIINGQFLATSQGEYIDLPANRIGINTYKAITLEAYIGSGPLNAPNTMLAFFGNSDGHFGTDFIFLSTARAGHSVASISCKNSESPWSTATNSFADDIDDNRYHHVVNTFDNREMKLYIDGELVDVKSTTDHPENLIANLSNRFAYLGKSGYIPDRSWYGVIDQFNIYEGALDANAIKNSAENYVRTKKALPKDLRLTLSNVLENPGFMPETELAETFIKTYKEANFAVHPTIVRTTDFTRWSESCGKAFNKKLNADLDVNADFNPMRLDPGKLEGRGQFAFFQNDMSTIAEFIKEFDESADYNIITEILYQPQKSDRISVFGVHVMILNKEGENAFSFLLNSHHDYFAYNDLFAIKPDAKELEALELKCMDIAFEAFKKQIEHAESIMIN